MAAFKDKKSGTWYVQFRYTDWRGERQQKLKRGFATKREALEWERQFLMQKRADVSMTFESFAALYEKDVKPRLKLNTWLCKAHPVSNQQASVAAEESKRRKVRAAQGNRTCEILGAFQSGTCVLRNKESLSFLQNTIPRTGKTASALLHTVCTCEFIPCSQSNEGCVTRFISRANNALELRFFSKFGSPKMTRLVLAQL